MYAAVSTGSRSRVGEVAVVVGVFFATHFLGFAECFVPAPGGLGEGFAIVEGGGLAFDFVVDGAADGGGGVHVFELDLGAEFVAFVLAEGDVDVAAELAFFHVSIGDSSGDEDLLEGFDVGKGFFSGFDLGFGDDFHEGGAGAVEVDEGGFFEVGGFGDIFFEMDASEADDLAGVDDIFLVIFGVVVGVEGDASAEAEGGDRVG